MVLKTGGELRLPNPPTTSEEVPLFLEVLIRDLENTLNTPLNEIPEGGDAGQVLAKSTSGDYDVDWITLSGGGGPVVWGGLTGTLSNQTDLQTALNNKANTSHTHSAADITTGTLDNARISQSSVIQHQAALTITESQISDLGSYLAETFETVSANLKSWNYTLNYTSGVLTSIVYTDGSDTITKTLNYTSGQLTSVVLSGDTPSGIDLTKSLTYNGSDISSVSYS